MTQRDHRFPWCFLTLYFSFLVPENRDNEFFFPRFGGLPLVSNPTRGGALRRLRAHGGNGTEAEALTHVWYSPCRPPFRALPPVCTGSPVLFFAARQLGCLPWALLFLRIPYSLNS